MDKIDVTTAPVIANDQVAPDTFLLKVQGAFPAKPGQFYMLRAWGINPPLSRPMSVFDRTDKLLSFLYVKQGQGTHLLARLLPGDKLVLFGPLGNGWTRQGNQIALVGGGSGIAPLFYAAKVFGKVDVYLGFHAKPFLLRTFEQVAEQLYVSSESGENGQKGLINNVFQPHGYDTCYACGPCAMLEALRHPCQNAGVPLFVSLEERMACGIGACLGCMVRTTQGLRRVCRDGPIFRAKDVIWDD